METKTLPFQKMEIIEGGNCAGSIITMALGAAALITLNAATMGVGTFFIGAAGGWWGVINGARSIEEHCLN